MPVATTPSERFRVEADMLRPLAAYAERLARGATVMFEVPSTAGVPDVVLLVLDEAVRQERAASAPLVEPVDLRIMMTASAARGGLERCWSEGELADLARVSEAHLRRVVLPRLSDGGHLQVSGRGWQLLHRYRSLARRVVTVEAKLRDWRGAVGQAARHAAVADRAWVALDGATIAPARNHESWFTTYGVGLLSVSSNGGVKKVIAPAGGRVRRAGRELLVERSVALLRAGRTAGEIPVVFGERLLATRGADPRLQGALAG